MPPRCALGCPQTPARRFAAVSARGEDRGIGNRLDETRTQYRSRDAKDDVTASPLTGQSIPGRPWRTPGSVACARAAVEPSALRPMSNAATMEWTAVSCRRLVDPRWQHEFACVLYARLPQVSMCRPLKTALDIAEQLQ